MGGSVVDVWLEEVGRVKDYPKGSEQGRSWDIEIPNVE